MEWYMVFENKEGESDLTVVKPCQEKKAMKQFFFRVSLSEDSRKIPITHVLTCTQTEMMIMDYII